MTDSLVGSTWDVNMKGKRCSTVMKTTERDEVPTSYGRANGTRKRQRSSTRDHSTPSLDAQPKHKKLKSKPKVGAHKRSKKSSHVAARSPHYSSPDDEEESEDAEPIPKVVSEVMSRRGRPLPSYNNTHESFSVSPANSDSESDEEANEEVLNSESESGNTEDEAEQLRTSMPRPTFKSTDFEDLDDDNSFTKPANPIENMASEEDNEDGDSADDSSATRNAHYAATALSSLSASRAQIHDSADSDAQGQDRGLENTIAFSQPTEREPEEGAKPADAAQIATSDQHTFSPNSIFDPTERSIAPSTAAPAHAAKRRKQNQHKGSSMSDERPKHGVYSPPTSNSPEVEDGLATNSNRPMTTQGTFSINRPAKSKKSRSAKTQVQEDQPLVDSWSAATSSNPKATTRPSARGHRSTKFKSSERIQDSSDYGDPSPVRRTTAHSDRKGKSKAQPEIDYTSPPRQAKRVAKKNPVEDSPEDEFAPAPDHDARYRTVQLFHTQKPISIAVDADDALDSSDSRPVKRSQITGKRISIRRVGSAAVGKGRTGAFDGEEIFKLGKFREDFCREHAITVQTFNSMMEDISKVKSGNKWPWERYISKRTFMDDYYNVLPSRDKRSLRRYRERNFVNLEQRAAWTKDDDEMLMEMVREKGSKWVAIGHELGRTSDAVHQRYKHKLRHGDKAKTGTWTNAEIDALEGAIESCNSKAGKSASGNEQEVFWTEVSDRMGGTRTAQQCARHWRRVQKGGERPIRYSYASTGTPKVGRPSRPQKKPTLGKSSTKKVKAGTEEKSKSNFSKSVKPLDVCGDPIGEEGPMEQCASVTIPKRAKKTSQVSIDTTQHTFRGVDHASDQDQPLAQEEEQSESEEDREYQGTDILSEEIGMSQNADEEAQEDGDTQDDDKRQNGDDQQADADFNQQLQEVPRIQEGMIPIQTEVALKVSAVHQEEPDFEDAWAQQEAWQKEQEGKIAKEKVKRTKKEIKGKKIVCANDSLRADY